MRGEPLTGINSPDIEKNRAMTQCAPMALRKTPLLLYIYCKGLQGEAMTKKELADRLIEENGGKIRIAKRPLSRILGKRVSNIEYLLEDIPVMYDNQHHTSYFIDDIAEQIIKKGLRG